jgi:hypothetical protein
VLTRATAAAYIRPAAFNVSFGNGEGIEQRTIIDKIILKLIITLFGFKSIYIHGRRYSMRKTRRKTTTNVLVGASLFMGLPPG